MRLVYLIFIRLLDALALLLRSNVSKEAKILVLRWPNRCGSSSETATPSSPVSLTHRPHRALNQASPLRALPDPIDADITVTRRDRAGGLLHEYSQVA
ncbi:MAG: Integrase core protein [Streptosporangiaceae bacterium]|nr:Integrase core protein [Streptosporangiaceae bacterium]